MRRQYTDEERSQLVELVTSTGTTIGAAADRLGVHRTTASNWMRRAARPSAAPKPLPSKSHVTAPRFAQLVSASEASSVEVSIGGATIRVRPGFDEELLRAVVAALRGGAA
jgi:transposase-like protein